MTDQLTLQLMEYVKEFYFVQDNTSNLFDIEDPSTSKLFKFFSNLVISVIQEKMEFVQRDNRIPDSLFLENKYVSFEEYESRSWELENIFETNAAKLDQIKKNRIYQMEKRCKIVISRH